MGSLRSLAAGGASLGLLVLAGCSNSTLKTPPADMPAPIPAAELGGLPGVPYSDIVEAAGAPVVATGPVQDGKALVTIPYRYRHTAILTRDVTGFSFTVRGVRATAGSPGYYAGTFTGSRGSGNRAPWDMWCFLRGEPGSGRDPLCLFRNLPGLAAIAPTRSNPWLWYSFSPMTGTFNYVKTPIFERRRVDLPLALTLEYRFEGWRGEEPRVALYAAGGRVLELPPSRDPSGRTRLATIAGPFAVTRDPADPAAARIAPAAE
jgi:hypothetical protein